MMQIFVEIVKVGGAVRAAEVLPITIEIDVYPTSLPAFWIASMETMFICLIFLVCGMCAIAADPESATTTVILHVSFEVKEFTGAHVTPRTNIPIRAA